MTIATDRPRTLIVGGAPYDLASVPADAAFIRYKDPETGEIVDWEPDPDDEGDKQLVVVELTFLDAPPIQKIARALIEEFTEFRPLLDAKIISRWKRNGGPKQGSFARLPALVRETLNADFIVWLAADHLRARKITNWELEAQIYYFLCHAAELPHYEGFPHEISRYGTWRRELQVLDAAIVDSKQARLPGMERMR